MMTTTTTTMYPKFTTTLEAFLEDSHFEWTILITEKLLEFFTKNGMELANEEELDEFCALDSAPELGPFESTVSALMRHYCPDLDETTIFHIIMFPSLVWHTTVHKNRTIQSDTEK